MSVVWTLLLALSLESSHEIIPREQGPLQSRMVAPAKAGMGDCHVYPCGNLPLDSVVSQPLPICPEVLQDVKAVSKWPSRLVSLLSHPS